MFAGTLTKIKGLTLVPAVVSLRREVSSDAWPSCRTMFLASFASGENQTLGAASLAASH